jgi:hypothetical protein
MASQAIPPTVQEISNPLRGQYEDVNPLFRQAIPRSGGIRRGLRRMTPVSVSRGGSCGLPIRARCPSTLLTIASSTSA